jgi:hypothetical protein
MLVAHVLVLAYVLVLTYVLVLAYVLAHFLTLQPCQNHLGRFYSMILSLFEVGNARHI